MKNLWRYFLAVALAFSFACAPFANFVRAQNPQTSSPAIEGFTAGGASTERSLEEQFRAAPAAAQAREHLRRLTAQPHIAGSPEDYETALYVRDQFRSYGLPVEIKEYQVLLPYPKQPSVVELVSPRRERLKMQEAVVAEDPTSANPKSVPLFNGYSPSADVTAPLLYVNYGLPDDYEALKKLNVDAKGKIVIARYGKSFRGVKAKVAEQNGAVGVIIYSDPSDDGYAQGDVYPQGPWRSETSAQRGSVQYLFDYPGDPLTPGVAAVEGAKRLEMKDVTDLPRIPVQPLSYGDARLLLQPLRGQVRPRGFQGGLPFAYHIGGTNDVRVHLKTDMDYAVRKIWDVVARVDGAGAESDRWVILGNHRDAWVFGAVDPNSGTAAMLETGRALGQLMKNGWRPRRAILLCSWDAEEYGLIGSTEWAEENADALKEKAVAYLNMDSAVSGANFGISSVPSMWKLIRAATRDVNDPKTNKSIYEAWQEKARADAPPEIEAGTSGKTTRVTEAKIGALGSGSDFTPFIQHLGVPALDMGFGGDYGVYHSIYDSFHWMEKFGDPTFQYHATAAKLWGTIALRLANASALPLDYTDYAAQIRDFVAETERTATERKLDGSFDAKALTAAANALETESTKLNEKARDLLVRDAEKDGATSNAAVHLRRINDALIQAERALTDERGLRGRTWYKHQIYAPGYYTGYASQPLPDLRQAIDDRNTTNAREASARILEAIGRATEVLRRARE